MSESLPRDYFDQVYRENKDPWRFETSPYEADKYRVSLDMLPNEQYNNAFEIGCSIGVFTKLLAPRCQRLLAVDTASIALEKAKQRCQKITQVTFALMSVPDEFPSEQFNLIVLSEVGYYFSEHDLSRLGKKITRHAIPGAHLLLVHWLLPVHDYPIGGDQVHEHFQTLTGWNQLSGHRTDHYRADVLVRNE